VVGWANTDTGATPFPDATLGAKAAVKYVNAKLGGINGHPMKLDTCSVGTDDASNLMCGEKFANDKAISVLEFGILLDGGPLYSATKAAGKYGISTESLTPADGTTTDTTFETTGNGLGAALEQYIVAHYPAGSKVGVVYLNNAGALTPANVLEKNLPSSYGFTSVAVDADAPTATAQIASLGTVNAYVDICAGQMCISTVQAIHALEPTAKILFTESAGDKSILDSVGTDMTGSVVLSLTALTTLTGKIPSDVATYLKEIKVYGGTGGNPAYYGDANNAQAWGLTITLAHILSGIHGTITPAKVHKAILAFKGPENMGVPNLSCPGQLIANSCTNEELAYEVVQANGTTALKPLAPVVIKPKLVKSLNGATG
jgi:branched-chain amino acid transport system substrate-binding protein